MPKAYQTMRRLGWTHLREEAPVAQRACLISNGKTVEMAFLPSTWMPDEPDWSMARWYDVNDIYVRFDHSLWHRCVGRGYEWKWWKYDDL